MNFHFESSTVTLVVFLASPSLWQTTMQKVSLWWCHFWKQVEQHFIFLPADEKPLLSLFYVCFHKFSCTLTDNILMLFFFFYPLFWFFNYSGEKKLGSGMSMHPFPDISNLAIGDSSTVTMGIDFRDTTQPATFEIRYERVMGKEIPL